MIRTGKEMNFETRWIIQDLLEGWRAGGIFKLWRSKRYWKRLRVSRRTFEAICSVLEFVLTQ